LTSKELVFDAHFSEVSSMIMHPLARTTPLSRKKLLIWSR